MNLIQTSLSVDSESEAKSGRSREYDRTPKLRQHVRCYPLGLSSSSGKATPSKSLPRRQLLRAGLGSRAYDIAPNHSSTNYLGSWPERASAGLSQLSGAGLSAPAHPSRISPSKCTPSPSGAAFCR
jgi:hypothetical protein